MRLDRVIVVGGSLGGLSTALALRHHAAGITVLERNSRKDTGGGLGVDLDLLAAATGFDARRTLPAVVSSGRSITTWAALRAWLAGHADGIADIEFVDDCEIVGVDELDEGIAVRDVRGNRYKADAVIGADGYRSVVRRFVAPEQPFARYAGYLLWRALVPESAAPDVSTYSNGISRNGQLFVVYPVPGSTGSVKRGERQFTFGWYDRRFTALLATLGIVVDGTVRGTLRADRVPREILDALRNDASQWPPPWNAVAGYAVSHGIFGTPISEYRPTRLRRGLAALVGDAAHVAPPILGAGFEMTLLDAIALRDAIESRSTAAESLVAYERSRLAPAQRFVEAGSAWSRSFVAQPPVVANSHK